MPPTYKLVTVPESQPTKKGGGSAGMRYYANDGSRFAWKLYPTSPLFYSSHANENSGVRGEAEALLAYKAQALCAALGFAPAVGSLIEAYIRCPVERWDPTKPNFFNSVLGAWDTTTETIRFVGYETERVFLATDALASLGLANTYGWDIETLRHAGFGPEYDRLLADAKTLGINNDLHLYNFGFLPSGSLGLIDFGADSFHSQDFGTPRSIDPLQGAALPHEWDALASSLTAA
jgi:hypothetical protein